LLRLLGEEQLLQFSFEGIKRLLGTHQETLSRVIGRLEEKHLIRKTSTGYAVTAEGKTLLPQAGISDRNRFLLLRSILPSAASAEALTSRLSGSWFGRLRWLGLSYDVSSTILKWVAEDATFQIEASISVNELAIYTNVIGQGYIGNAVEAAYQLASHISSILSSLGANGKWRETRDN
ncbi:MAG: hypothetical protein QXP70_05685, partial [Methanomassiliicoccales archaeon]